YKYKEELYKDVYNMANENKLKNITELKDSKEVCACNEERDWPILYSTNVKAEKRRYKLKKRFRKILLGCVVISLVLVITILKFCLFKRR
ncbi:hypothetical protein G8T83_10900, partial [Clostridium botulinum D/C]|nr:hypothetical protein [Clostridium botulinum D/C]